MNVNSENQNVSTFENLTEDMIKKDKIQRWNGWGYADCEFFLNKEKVTQFVGPRYDFNGKIFPKIKPFMKYKAGCNIMFTTERKDKIDYIQPPIINETFKNWLLENKFSFSLDGMHRVNRSHGHTVLDIVELRCGMCKSRIPDIVLWPSCHDDVVKIVKVANEMNVAIIPFGGGTSVSHALTCPENETRCIISLDMCRMNRVLWIDQQNMIARAEGGIVGSDLERILNEKGVTTGHEPDSMEFSTLGGWVATRASGIRRNKYGNIEDLVLQITMVSPQGVINKSCIVPRLSAGPDISHFILGSEGTLGVVTEVSFKIFNISGRRYGSILFPDFASGFHFMHEITLQKCIPASIRLMDNNQYTFGQAIRPHGESWFKEIVEAIKMGAVKHLLRFDENKMCPIIIVFEGTDEEIAVQEKNLYRIAKKFGGYKGGQTNGLYGYRLTYIIAYLRDIGLNYSGLAESFETSVSWDKALILIRNVNETIMRLGKQLGLLFPVFLSCRVTQIYDTGVCLYFYMAFNFRDMYQCMTVNERIHAALKLFEQLEDAGRHEILACGGSISHHHGVGKLRKHFLPSIVGNTGLSILRAVKQQLDPNNIFACGNLYDVAKL